MPAKPLDCGTVPGHSFSAQLECERTVCDSSMFEGVRGSSDLLKLVQAQDTICTDTPNVCIDQTQKAVCRNTSPSSPSPFFKATWRSQILNVRDSGPCQGLHLLNLKRRVVSGKFLVLGQLETFSQNKGSFSPCRREPEEPPAQLGSHKPPALRQVDLGSQVTCHWTTHRVGLPLSHTQGDQGSLVDH